ncbi:MAG: class I SAM-dependent methyltransferase, partial [Verrucomicrobia bacterium]|nr:class I SAM-dependent methyltransferase [Verrucomicrobiota bacterium]
MIKDQCTPYLLGTNMQAAKNLDQQHEQIAFFAYEQLERAGLRRGMIVWDVGCGSGAMTEYLARSVGEEGHVYALDVSENQVARTCERLHQAGFKNFTCLQGDITATLDSPKGEADLVYARMVLMHLKNPEVALLQMAQLLKRGGVLSLQESIMHTASISPAHEAVDDYFRTLIKLGNFHGVDFNIG